MTSKNLLDYHIDEANDDLNENSVDGCYKINNNKIARSVSFEYKTKIIGSIPAGNNILDTEVGVSLKYLYNL